jgi:hypothetical protein
MINLKDFVYAMLLALLIGATAAQQQAIMNLSKVQAKLIESDQALAKKMDKQDNDVVDLFREVIQIIVDNAEESSE